jgi:transcriptional regulator with XRE-family HTH domain
LPLVAAEQAQSVADGERAVSAAQAEELVRRQALAVGEVIREARRGRYSLEDLAQRAGVSAGFLSQLERGLSNPSMTTLTKIAAALDLPLGQFFQGPQLEGRMVVRAAARRKLVLPHEGLVYEILTPDLRGSLAMLLSTIGPGFDNSDEPFQHRGEECVFLLSGSLDVVVAGQAFSLEAGDSVRYDPSLPHWFRNRSTEPAQIVGAVTPPNI